MNFFKWLGGPTNRSKSLSLYKRGLAKAKKHDNQGAIHDYSTTIDNPETPLDLKAMALHKRALLRLAAGENAMGVADLKAILAMDEPPVNLRTMARQELSRTDS